VRHRFDQLGKQIGQEALGPSGPTVAHDEIAPDAQHADLRHEPDPSRQAERERLGLLGRLAAILCIIELYSHAPEEDEGLACVSKLIAFRQKRARSDRQRRAGQAGNDKLTATFTKPFLLIITAGRQTAVLDELGATSSPDWPPGIYFSPRLFQMGIVVASELPRDRSTLLLRLMAAGPLLPQAIEDLSALPEDAYERTVAEQILLKLKHVLGKKPSRTPEEQEFIVRMQDTWAKARELGSVERAAQAVLTVLRVRGIDVPAAARERILAQQDPERLERWLERAVVAASVAEVIGKPS
jgi:hypothetical protein